MFYPPERGVKNSAFTFMIFPVYEVLIPSEESQIILLHLFDKTYSKRLLSL